MQRDANTMAIVSSAPRWDLVKTNKMATSDAAVYYRSLNLPVVPTRLNNQGKHVPYLLGYQNLRWSLEEVRDHWRRHPSDGIALLLGVADAGFRNVHAIDLDRHSRPLPGGGEQRSDGIKSFKDLVPDWKAWLADAIIAETPGGGRHILVSAGFSGRSIGRGPHGGVDRFGAGVIVMSPTERHGKRYRWIQNGILKPAPPAILALPYAKQPRAATDTDNAEASGAQKKVSVATGDDQATTSRAQISVRDVDLDTLPITESLKEAIRSCSGPEVERFGGDRSAMVGHVAFRLYIEGVSRDEALSLLTQRAHLIAEKPLENRNGDRASAAEWVDSYQWAQAARKIATKRWQRFRELDGQDMRPPRVEFPLPSLPGPLRNLVTQVASSIGMDPALLAGQALAVLSALVARWFDVLPGGSTKSWRARPLLWSLAIAPPGTGKTPALNAILAPIQTVQEGYLREYQAAKDLHEQAQALKRTRRTAKATDAKPEAADDLPDLAAASLPKAPACRRIVVGDATVEALQVRMEENPDRPMILLRDEIVGLLTKLSDDRYAADRSFLLSCAEGNTTEIVDRISRGTVFLKEPALAVLGNATPNRILREFSGVSRDDGLMQRFQLVCCPEPEYRKRSWEAEDTSVRKAWETLVMGLASGPGNAEHATTPEMIFNPSDARRIPLAFDEPAQRAFIEADERLREEMSFGRSSDGLASHLAKFPRFVAALSGILHVVENWPAVPPEISLATLNRAMALAAYYRDQAERLYEAGESPSALARAVVRALPELGSRFSGRDLARKVSPLRDPEVAERVLSCLVAHGHLREVGVIRTAGTGRNPSPTYAVHPVLAERCGLPQHDWGAGDFADLVGRQVEPSTVDPNRPHRSKPEPAAVPVVQGGPAPNIADSLPSDPRPADPGQGKAA
jgi:hypothetical protein